MNADEQIEQAPHVKSPETYSLKTENSDARVMLTPKLIASSPELKVESSTVSNLSPPPFTAPLTPPKSFEEKQISNNPTELVPVQTQLAPLAETNNLKISTAKTSTSQTIETRDRIVIEPRVEKIENRVENKSIQQTIIPATQKQQISKQISEYAETTETPTINVTIGRVEIRAAVSSTPPKPISAKPPTLSLDEYLNKRHNGGER